MIIEPAVIESVYLVWPFVRERARKACERVGVSKFEDLERNTLDGTYMNWLIRDGHGLYGFVTIAKCDDACEIMQCIGTGVSLYRYPKLLKRIEKFARKNGLKVMRLYGRKGWKRILKDYKVMEEHPNYLVLERPL